MTAINTGQTTPSARRIPRQPAEHPEAGKAYEIPCDENGEPAGYTPDEVFSEVDERLSAAYGVDFAKAARLVNSGKLTPDEVTDELLLSPEFKAGASKIPRDENGNPVGTPWEEIRERMYNNLSEHYGADLRTL